MMVKKYHFIRSKKNSKIDTVYNDLDNQKDEADLIVVIPSEDNSDKIINN